MGQNQFGSWLRVESQRRREQNPTEVRRSHWSEKQLESNRTMAPPIPAVVNGKVSGQGQSSEVGGDNRDLSGMTSWAEGIPVQRELPPKKMENKNGREQGVGRSNVKELSESFHLTDSVSCQTELCRSSSILTSLEIINEIRAGGVFREKGESTKNNEGGPKAIARGVELLPIETQASKESPISMRARP